MPREGGGGDGDSGGNAGGSGWGGGADDWNRDEQAELRRLEGTGDGLGGGMGRGMGPVAPATEPGTPAGAGAMRSTSVAMLSAVQVHWVALVVDGLPVAAVVHLVRELGAFVNRRVQHLTRVLHRYGVPLALRDGSNLVTGLVGVRPTPLPAGQLTHARRGPELVQWQPAALVAKAQALLQWHVEDVERMMDDLLDVHAPRSEETAVAVQPLATGLPIVGVLQRVQPGNGLHLPATMASMPAGERASDSGVDRVSTPSAATAALPEGGLMRELDRWLDWCEDGAGKLRRATFLVNVLLAATHSNSFTTSALRCERVCSVGCKRTSTSPGSWPLIARGRERVAGLAAKRTFTSPGPWSL